MKKNNLSLQDQKKHKIITEAVKVFAKNGYDKTTMDEIAENANVAKGTIFYYFSSKEKLFFGIITDGFDLLTTQLKNGLAGTVSPEEKIEKLLYIQFDFFTYYSNFCRIILSELWRLESYWKKDLEKVQKDYTTLVRKIIEDTKEQHIISEKLDTYALSTALFGLIAVSSLEWALYYKDIPKETMLYTLKTLLFQGIFHKPQSLIRVK